MQLLPGWEDILSEELSQEQEPFDGTVMIPRCADYYAKECTRLEGAEEVEGFVQLACERPLSHVGIGFGCTDAAASEQEAVLSIALYEAADGGDRLYRAEIATGLTEAIGRLKGLFRLSVPFVGYGMKGFLKKLWAWGFREPEQVWDCLIAEKSLKLGVHDERYLAPQEGERHGPGGGRSESRERQQYELSLVTMCRRYDIDLPLEAQRRWHAREMSEVKQSRQALGSLAEAVARLYLPQVLACSRGGVLQHLVSVEMPWVVTTAKMEATGVKIDVDRAIDVARENQETISHLEGQLASLGIANPRSTEQVLDFFEAEGLSDIFRGRDGKNLEKRFLKRHLSKHPAIAPLLEIRQAYSVRDCGLLDPSNIGRDGRVHPDYIQLGAHTGRQTSRDPNILGVPKTLRSLIVPEEGYGIGEVDLCQIEVGVAAAVYGDDKLVQMYNEGDVYSQMAQEFFREELSPEEACLGGEDFKARHPDKRDLMKTCTLSLIYGGGAAGVAAAIGCNLAEAEAFLTTFCALFRSLKTAQRRSVQLAGRRGYADCVSGLRRYRGMDGEVRLWEKRWMVNFPVQAGAAVAFKMAGNRLRHRYQELGARLLIPNHDAYFFEAPLERLEEVAKITGDAMCEAVRECFPQLRAKSAPVF